LPLHDRIGQWATTLRDHGVAALWKAIESDEGVTARTLSRPGGERLITDLRHVTEMIHAAHRSGAFSLHEWLLSAILHAEEDGDEERSRRLETDADAVQVLTAHASKGLEFPIVLCPFFWAQPPASNGVPVFHPEGSDRRLVAVGGSEGWDGHDRAVELVTRHNDGENMRLLYVALTRARHHVVCWWAATKDAAKTPLTRFLFGRVKDSIRETATVVTDARMWGHLDARVARAAGTMACQVLTAEPATDSYRPPAPAAPTVEVARFDRPIDRAWTRTSFSSLTHDAPHVTLVEAETVVKLDEPVDDEPATVDALPMADLPGGVAFGSLVHSVFEDVDLTASDRTERIRTVCERHVLAAGSDVDPAVLTDALVRVADTPLFAAADAPTLTDIPRSDQRAEMTFELSVSPSGPTVTLAGIADLLESRLDPADPMRAYADRIRTLSRTTFHGFLTGAIDGVVRLGSTFWVMDYKTNRLGDRTRPLTIADYAPDRLDRAMLEGDYVMQSLLYQVALHRFLAVRVPDYRPETHLGGSLYLFVRGMTGPDTPTRDGHRFGVHRWDAPHRLITGVSDLFDRGVA
jgi:exodeoxyribonuclease V beta subunit